ncbi:MAG: PQQ-like beta-propeller repeat protein, partial [Acidobacteria bacterium]|nr:PQQ-like beta-propeller repeat protein [Acidobacteriota bacterium]
NRYNGDLLYETVVDGAPGAGPALSAKRAYVPTVTGLVLAYRLQPLVDPLQELGKVKKDLTPEEKAKLDEERRQNIRLRQEFIPPLSCQSFGRTLVQPLVTRETSGEEYAAWPTDRGFLNIGRIDRQAEDAISLKYRLETAAPIVCRPAYLPPDPKVTGDSGLIFVGSRDGFLHAVQEKTGESLWRFSTGEPIAQSPAVVGDRVYVCTQLGGMYCLEAKTGKDLWWSPNLVQFVSASKGRVYAVDQIGRILVLNAQNGSRLDTIDAESVPIKLSNSDTDRLYLANDKGLIQCLHEVEQVEPLSYGQDRKLAAETVEKPAVAQKKIETGEAKEKPAKKERVAPKEKKERVAPIPKENKEQAKAKAEAAKAAKAAKAEAAKAAKAANKAPGGNVGGADENPFGAPAGGKAKGGKAKGNQNQADGNPFQ